MILGAAGVTFRVGPTALVEEASLEVGRGELLAIVGPNGAGKSTLVRILAGDLRPSDGEVTIDSSSVDRYDFDELALRRAVLAPQEVPDSPFSVAAIVGMSRHPHRLDPDASAEADAVAVRTAMERADVVGLASRVYATLSRGERTRVGLARVIAQETPIILADEPTTALDVAHHEAMMETLRELADAGRAVVAVLHDLNAAAHYADRIVVMDRGRIAAQGPPSAILDEDLLTRVYGRRMRVTTHPFRGSPLILVSDDGG